MNNLKIFEHEQFGSIRIIDQNGEPWFIASDVAKALGYADPAQAIKQHCKKAENIVWGDLTESTNTGFARIKQPLVIISESDLYRLIMRSKLPSAEIFQDWVVEEVLPSIRKHGAYSIDEFAPLTLRCKLPSKIYPINLQEVL